MFDTLTIALNDCRRLPLFWPGALIALVPGEAPAGRLSLDVRSAGTHRRRPGRRRFRAARDSVLIGHIDCGPDRIQLRLIRRRSAGGACASAHCRLTAFIHAPDIVNQLARAVTRRDLCAARRALTQGAPNRYLTRELRVHLLLTLQSRRSLPAAARRHPQLEKEWRELVRHEHRRMLKRLRHAVRRLQRVLEDGQGP